jgi:MFS-type transporter involved in bile tolerance (Atg22 family)
VALLTEGGPADNAAAMKEHVADTAAATRREVFAWAMYDWANSAYSTLSITVLVSYLQGALLPGEPGVRVWGWGIGLTELIVAVSSPVLGAVADAHASKRFWLGLTAPSCRKVSITASCRRSPMSGTWGGFRPGGLRWAMWGAAWPCWLF